MVPNYTALKTELSTDPTALGYAPLLAAGNHNGVAGVINQVRPTILIGRGVIPVYTILEAIVVADYNTLGPQERQRLAVLLGMGSINVSGPNTRAHLNLLFNPATGTHAALVSIYDRPGSRAEQLFGAGVIVTAEDVALALQA